jgi:hypothetical protein
MRIKKEAYPAAGSRSEQHLLIDVVDLPDAQ